VSLFLSLSRQPLPPCRQKRPRPPPSHRSPPTRRASKSRRPPPVRNPKPEAAPHAAATEGAECGSASAGVAWLQRRARSGRGTGSRAASRSPGRKHPFPSLPLKPRFACSAWFGRIGCCIAGSGGFAACLIWCFNFFSFCGDDSCGLGSSELLVSIAAVSDNPVVSRRKINLRFCAGTGEQNFWASRKERGLVCLRV